MERVMTTAAETYRTRLADVRNLIRRLEGSLLIHERRQTARPDQWGFAGDLGHIAERLREIIASPLDRRCERKGGPMVCGEYALVCLPDGRLVCMGHAPESGADPSECLDLADGTPVDQD
jgi:hypothetical protein